MSPEDELVKGVHNAMMSAVLFAKESPHNMDVTLKRCMKPASSDDLEALIQAQQMIGVGITELSLLGYSVTFMEPKP